MVFAAVVVAALLRLFVRLKFDDVTAHGGGRLCAPCTGLAKV